MKLNIPQLPIRIEIRVVMYFSSVIIIIIINVNEFLCEKRTNDEQKKQIPIHLVHYIENNVGVDIS